MNYEIMPVNKMFNDISDLDNQFVSLDSVTMSKIYYGNSKDYYLIPAVGPLGIRAKKDVIDSILASGRIPLEEKNPSIFQVHGESILKINEMEGEIVSQFFLKYKLNEEDILGGNYNDIDRLLNLKKGKSRYEKYFFELGVLLGNVIKRATDVKWVLEKRYGYNPYYGPKLFDIKKDSYIDPWYYLSRALLSNQKFSFKECLSNALTIRKKQ